MRKMWIGILAMTAFAGTHPALSVARTDKTNAACGRLIDVLEGKAPGKAYEALHRMEVYRQGNHYEACTNTAQAVDGASLSRADVKVAKIAGMDVFNEKGEQVGDIDSLARGQDRRIYVLMTYRGARWPGNKKVAVPLDRMILQSGRLLLLGVGEKQLLAMPSVPHIGHPYQALSTNQIVSIRSASDSPSETGSISHRR
jgi:hypothetical protein